MDLEAAQGLKAVGPAFLGLPFGLRRRIRSDRRRGRRFWPAWVEIDSIAPTGEVFPLRESEHKPLQLMYRSVA